MITYFIYAIILIILLYVLYLAVKAITIGIEAKQNLKNEEQLKLKDSKNKNIVEEINKLKILYNDGTLNKEEFNKAKQKLLK